MYVVIVYVVITYVVIVYVVITYVVIIITRIVTYPCPNAKLVSSQSVEENVCRRLVETVPAA